MCLLEYLQCKDFINVQVVTNGVCVVPEHKRQLMLYRSKDWLLGCDQHIRGASRGAPRDTALLTCALYNAFKYLGPLECFAQLCLRFAENNAWSEGCDDAIVSYTPAASVALAPVLPSILQKLRETCPLPTIDRVCEHVWTYNPRISAWSVREFLVRIDMRNLFTNE